MSYVAYRIIQFEHFDAETFAFFRDELLENILPLNFRISPTAKYSLGL